ncbi:MAG: hypothetical protein AAGJ40_09590 [Planctomycetota bacterium]
MPKNIGSSSGTSEQLSDAPKVIEEHELEKKRIEFVEWQQSEHFDVDDIDYKTVESFIETCDETMVPALVSVAVKAAVRVGCFRSDFSALRFVATSMEEEAKEYRETTGPSGRAVVDALLRPCGQVAWPGHVADDEVDFAVDLERLAELMDTLEGASLVANGLTHSPELWAVALRAKAKQMRELQTHEPIAKDNHDAS